MQDKHRSETMSKQITVKQRERERERERGLTERER